MNLCSISVKANSKTKPHLLNEHTLSHYGLFSLHESNEEAFMCIKLQLKSAQAALFL